MDDKNKDASNALDQEFVRTVNNAGIVSHAMEMASANIF
jgi:hypothetical protein